MRNRKVKEEGWILVNSKAVLKSNEEELDELEGGQVLTPPSFDPQRGNKVMGVHQNMDAGVQEAREIIVPPKVVRKKEPCHNFWIFLKKNF